MERQWHHVLQGIDQRVGDAHEMAAECDRHLRNVGVVDLRDDEGVPAPTWVCFQETERVLISLG